MFRLMSDYDCYDHQTIRYLSESEHITDSMEHDALAPSTPQPSKRMYVCVYG